MGVNNNDKELDDLDTLSLTDFTLTEDIDSDFQDHRYQNPTSSANEDLFEFCSLGSMMSHAEDMIIGGKLIPINDQPKKLIHRRRSESMRELKSNTNKGQTSHLTRNSHSLDYKKLSRNSRLIYEPMTENHRNSLSNKTSSSRWSDLVFGPIKGPPEMDLQDIRNRQVVQNTWKSLFPGGDSGDRFTVSRSGCHRKSSWGVLGILSCKSSDSVAVTMPLS